MKLILKNEVFYLLSFEDLKEGDYYSIFATGIRGFLRGWGNIRKHENSNIDKLNNCVVTEYKGKVIASSVKICDLPLIDMEQITENNYIPFINNIELGSLGVEDMATQYARSKNDSKTLTENEFNLCEIAFKSGFDKCSMNNYKKKFTRKQMYDLAFETYLNAHVYVNPHAISEFIDKEIKKIDVEKNEWSVEVEFEWNPISDFCDECGSGTKVECDNFCKNRQLKINDKGFVNILKIS